MKFITHTKTPALSSCGAVFGAWSFDVIEGQDVNRVLVLLNLLIVKVLIGIADLSTRDRFGAHQHGLEVNVKLPGSVYSEPYPVLEGLSSVKQTRLKQLM